jgi:hypothetical protein
VIRIVIGFAMVLLGAELAAGEVVRMAHRRRHVRAHGHHCQACNIGWIHVMNPQWSAQEAEDAHRCPRCGIICPEVVN